MVEKPAERYRRGNLEAARIILESPDRYRGLLLDWARHYLSAHNSSSILSGAGESRAAMLETYNQEKRLT